MKSGLWLSQRQVRWLIVLLALLPLIPSVLLVQLMVQNAMRDRDGAVAEITSIYRGQLSLIVERFSLEQPERGGVELYDYMRRVFGEEVKLAVTDPNGNPVDASEVAQSRDAIIYQITDGEYAGWSISLDGVPVFPDHIEEEKRQTLWHAAVIMGGVVLAAGGVWFTVHRRLRVDAIRSDLLTTISHEIKTPVAAMKVLIETLEDGQLDEKATEEYLGLLEKENERVRELADQFLTFSRLEKGQVSIQKVESRVPRLIEEQVELFRPQFERMGGSVSWSCLDDVVVVTDPQALKVVLANLLNNALKYGGSPPKAEVSVEATGRQVMISVTDGGEGIRQRDRRVIFQRFFRGDARLNQGKAGVGLGLAICRRFMKLLRGAVYVDPAWTGPGARFVVSLPART
ncbi:MAG: HAMP domain-containing histidine kinase [Verrucomicrobiales bacterium]|nr:HAMP domain-containing histidine kinase [Verrucomicrobiales bacterium]